MNIPLPLRFVTQEGLDFALSKLNKQCHIVLTYGVPRDDWQTLMGSKYVKMLVSFINWVFTNLVQHAVHSNK